MKINSFGKIKINVNSSQHKIRHGDGDRSCASVDEIMKTRKLNVDWKLLLNIPTVDQRKRFRK